jgi:hypothetical protein
MMLFYRNINILLLLFCVLIGRPLLAQDTDGSFKVEPDSAYLNLTSSPDSASVSMNGSSIINVTPLNLALSPGPYRFDASREGFEPLTYELNLMVGQRISAQFILKSLPPPPIQPESLGLFYIPEQPLQDVASADQLRQSFNRWAEIFAIIPLGQGILAKLVVDDENQKQVNILIITGATLSLGSLVLGKVLSNRKRNQIEEANLRIKEENMVSQSHNSEIDRQLREKNDEALQEWLLENEGRGRVIMEEP